MAIDVAGFTASQADELRQAMGSKRSHLRMERLRQRLYDGMSQRGVVGPVADEDPAENDAGEVGRDHLEDTPPGASRRTRPLEHLDAPAPRSTYMKVLRGGPECDAFPGQSPGGRPGGRPSPSLDGGPPQTDHPDTMTAEAAAAAGERMREALENGRGVDPADVRLVDRWAEHDRRAERGEVAA